jgi:hypothetical protein
MINRLARWAPLLGLAYGLLLAAVLFSTPSPPAVDASTAKIIHFYASHRGALQLQVYLLAYCGVAVVAFFGVLAAYLRRYGAESLARVGIAGAVVMATGYGIGAGCDVLVSHKSVAVTAANAQILNLLNDDLPFVALALGSVLAMVSLGIAILQTKALPAWLGWVAIVAGLGSGTGTFVSFIGILLGALWAIAASVVLYRRMATAAPATITLPAAPADVPSQGQSQESGSRIRG